MGITVEATFGAVLDAAPDAMLIVDRQGRIVLANTLSEQMFGYARKELVGQKVEVLVPPRFRSKHPGHRAGYFSGDPHVQAHGRRTGTARAAKRWQRVSRSKSA